MIISKEQLRTQLQRREFAPVYVLFGSEPYLRNLAEKTIANLAFNEGDLRDFNDTTFTLGSDVSLQHALSAAQQLPMMAARRVIRISDVRISASGYRDTVTEADEKFLDAYLSDPSPSSIVVLIADELNGVRKMGKYLRDKLTAVEFHPLSEKELPGWVAGEMKKAGLEPDDLVARYLVDRVGADMFRLSNEIKKLAVAAVPAKRISTEQIDEMVPESRELTNFQLTDHLIAGRRAKALAVLKRILDDGAEPLALLGLISYNYRRLLMAKDMMLRGAARGDVERVLKMRYNDQERFLTVARRADMKNLSRAIGLLAKVDLAIKSSIGGSGPAGARMQIEMLVCELALMQQPV